MIVKYLQNTLKKKRTLLKFRMLNWSKKRYQCPICLYHGPFQDLTPSTGLRRHAKCPNCGSLERHRLQYLVLKSIATHRDFSKVRILHCAPESFFRLLFSAWFNHYETADLHRDDVDHNVDLQDLPFVDSSYDMIFASHILEHIPNDTQAIREIRRVLSPQGLAILPVPLVTEKTIEYPEPNPYESGHVRSVGFDYFARYLPYFSRVEQYTSDSQPERYQVFIYENRSQWPSRECPLRPAMQGEKHADIVPVCYV